MLYTLAQKHEGTNFVRLTFSHPNGSVVEKRLKATVSGEYVVGQKYILDLNTCQIINEPDPNYTPKVAEPDEPVAEARTEPEFVFDDAEPERVGSDLDALNDADLDALTNPDA